MKSSCCIAGLLFITGCCCVAPANGQQQPYYANWGVASLSHVSLGTFAPMDTPKGTSARAGYALSTGWAVATDTWQFVTRIGYNQFSLRDQSNGVTRGMDQYNLMLELHSARGTNDRMWLGPAVGLVHVRSGQSNHTGLAYGLSTGLSSGRLFMEARLIRGTVKEANGAVFTVGSYFPF